MTFGILILFLIVPLSISFLIGAIIAAIKNNAAYAGVLLLSCFLLPLSFFASMKLLNVIGWVEYKKPEYNAMRPLDAQPNGSIIIVYNKGTTYDDRKKLEDQLISPWKEGPEFTHETGVCSGVGSLDIAERPTEKVFFCESATDAEKDKLRMGLDASSLVYRYFENMSENEVRKKLEDNNKL